MNWTHSTHNADTQVNKMYDASTPPYKTTYQPHSSQFPYISNTHSRNFEYSDMGNLNGSAKKSYLAYTESELEEANVTNASFDAAAFALKKNNTVINSGIMFAMGVFGNLLALIVLMRSGPEQRRTLFYRLVAGLTLTDLLGTTMTSPVVIAVYVNDFQWIGGQLMCNYFGYMMIMAGFSTMTIVCMMSIERVICIKHPYVYHTRLSKKHATIFLFACWIFAAIIAALPLIGFGDMVLQYPYTWCFFDYYTQKSVHKGFNYLYAILALTIISTTVVCNLTVMYTLLRSWRKKRTMDRDSRKYSGYSKRFAECQMLVLLVGITVVFSTCYTPLMVRIIINQTGLFTVNKKTDLLMIRFASFNQILDPWVYILLRRELVWKVIQAVKYILGIKPKEPDYELSLQKLTLDNESDSCCWFCQHCLCDPPIPKRQRSESLFSTSEYELRRSTIISKSTSSPMSTRNGAVSRLITTGSEKELNLLLSTLQKQKAKANGNRE